MGLFRKRLDPGLSDVLQVAMLARQALEECGIAVRLEGVDDDLPTDLTYGRPFAPGVIEVLCVDYPRTVATLGGTCWPNVL